MVGPFEIFISYSTKDKDLFSIIELKNYLTTIPKIKRVFIWEEDVEEDIYDFMEKYIPKSDLMIVCCSQNYLNSRPCNKEWQAADRDKKQLIPVFFEDQHIPFLLRNTMGVKWDKSATKQDNFKNIEREVLHRIEKCLEPENITSQSGPKIENSESALISKKDLEALWSISEIADENILFENIKLNLLTNADRLLIEEIIGKLQQATLNERRISGPANLWYRLGRIMDKLKMYDNAESLYKLALSANQKYTNAWTTLGIFYYTIKRNYDESERCYKNAIESNPKDALTWCNLGLLYYSIKKDYAESERCYRKALEANSNYEFAWYNLGVINHVIKGDYIEAERCYKKALESNPNHAATWCNLGTLYYNIKKNYTEAERCFEKYRELEKRKKV